MKRYKLLVLGAWQFFHDVAAGGVADPFSVPGAIIVSTVRWEPYVARGDVHIRRRLVSFTRGLEHLQSLLEYQPIVLALPEEESAFGAKVREAVRGHAFVKTVSVPRRYGVEDFRVLARALDLVPRTGAPVWGLRTAGVLAADRALTLGRPSTVRIVSVAGPSIRQPRHVRAMPGYPLAELLAPNVEPGAHRVLAGGVFTGEDITTTRRGLDVECEGLTVLPEHEEREFLSFLRPGRRRGSFSECFLSALGGASEEPLTTALRGEVRPCVSCGFCERVCPAGIMPHVIHKYLYADALEEAERARPDLCTGCGLCSYVCPSKIDLTRQLVDAQETIRCELHAEVEDE